MQSKLFMQRQHNTVSRAFLASLYRNLLRLFRNKASLVSLFVIPGVMMSCLMAVFGHAAQQYGMDYSLYLMAGGIFQAVMFSAGGSVMAIAVDVDQGLLDRSLTTPAALADVFAGRLACDLIRSILSVLTVVVVGLLWGAQVHSLTGLILAILYGLVIGAVLSLVFMAISLPQKDPVQMAGIIQGIEMLFLMASTAFIPAQTLPPLVSNLVYHQPFSPLIDTLRALLMGQHPAERAFEGVAWLALASLVSAMVLYRTLRRRNR